MDNKELKQLIQFHKDGLGQYRQFMSPSAQYLEERTIKMLEILTKGLRVNNIGELPQGKGMIVFIPDKEG